MSQELLIGIDGGGTHSAGVAVWPDGRIAASTSGGGLNFHNDGVDAVRRRLENLVRELLAKAGASSARVCVGLSALDGPADPETLALFTSSLLPPGSLFLESDAYAALLGCTRGGPGMIVICGTGSMILLLDSAGRQLVSGGWGYLLGDAGSGYTLAREALLAVIAEADGVGPATRLTPRAMTFFGVSAPRQLIDRIYAPGFSPDQLAAFARCVTEEAALGEPAAADILKRNMQRLAALAARQLRQAPEIRTVGLYGGIFAHSPAARSAFKSALRAAVPDADIRDPEFPPEIGAVLHLLRQEGTPEPNVLARLKTYRHI